MPFIDLRSDTVTQPTPQMRQAMAAAPVGDDVFGEDPTVCELEARVAALLGKEAALFVVSGTMANQLAIWTQTRPGDEVIVGREAHVAVYETGAAAALAGVQMSYVGEDGLFTAEDVSRAIRPLHDYSPRTSLVALENTHNRSGGRVFSLESCRAIALVARQGGLAAHLDGARLWNASVKSGVPVQDFAAPFDTVSVCFSKGLGAPVGSALAGSRDLIREARRRRKMLGGGMRQAGILAAAALYALEHHRERLRLDHEAAHAFAARLARTPGISVEPAAVETNIVNLAVSEGMAPHIAARARELGVIVSAIQPSVLRAVTHLDVSKAEVLQAAEVLGRVAVELAPRS